MGGCAQVICKSYAILYNGLEQPWILVSASVLESIPHGYWGTTLLVFTDVTKLWLIRGNTVSMGYILNWMGKTQNTKNAIKYRTSESYQEFTFGGYQLKEKGHL